ncbi:subtilisin-like protein [Coprinopsis marcescibilis]|uniref:Subtilisin-like protein n=1 Tax=Coprinopsis marcescibilis TaxID=230819 RepID=A0A5C3L8K0_COPMA|nr:subtilisin-like protein [Coprinopsis marcescibilis]
MSIDSPYINMRLTSYLSTVSVLLAAFTAIHAAPPVPVAKYSGATSGRHIVQLKPDASRSDWIQKLGLPEDTVQWDLINGFTAQLSEDALAMLQSSEEVDNISESGLPPALSDVFEAATTPSNGTRRLRNNGAEDTVDVLGKVTQNSASWGLQRISQREPLARQYWEYPSSKYTYDNATAGSGVDIYIIDGGVSMEHNEFKGRIRFGTRTLYPTHPPEWGFLTGTFCASVAAGTRWGIAKNANIISVVAYLLTTYDTLISALDWVAQQVKATGRPSIAHIHTIRHGFIGPSVPLDNAAANLVSRGIHVVIGAGDDNVDVANSRSPSPARVPSVITVGASEVTDTRFTSSNYGARVDLHAPGAGVQTADLLPGGHYEGAYADRWGTSIASSHVAGIIAYLISKDGNATPAAMKDKLLKLAVRDALRGLPAGTPNLLAQLGPV